EVEQLVDDAVALLEQDVLAGDAGVGGARLHVRGDVRGPHRDERDVAELEDERAGLAAERRRVELDPVEVVERPLEERPPGQGEPHRPLGGRGASGGERRAPRGRLSRESTSAWATCTRSRECAKPAGGSGRP